VRLAPFASLALLAGCLESPPGADPAVVVADAQPGPDATPCPPDAVCIIDDISGHSYALQAEVVTWEKAVARCDETGWYLATDRSELESVLIQGLLQAPAWIGGSDISGEDQWTWVTGEPFDYQHWYGSEPNGDVSENCLLAGWQGVGWNDSTCNGTYRYVCEFGLP
jgi:hypothetical protein